MTTVAIVGRANVGKSTLFNRLAGRRLAIVHEQPGATRDRRAAPARLGDLVFEAVDTAGLEDIDDDSLPARMRRQSEEALAGADVVLFLVDARSGITAQDETIARHLRRCGKRVIVVANKAEGRAGDAGAMEAWRLGLGEAVAISAEHGEGLGDLHSVLAAAMDALGPEGGDHRPVEGERPIRIAIVGRPNAGKSTLANRLIGEERLLTGPEAGITRDAIEVDIVVGGRAMRLVDTAGLRRKARIAEGLERLAVKDALHAIAFAEVVLLVMDGTHPFETQDLHIADLVEREGRAIVFVLAKWDLVDDPGQRLRALLETLRERLPQLRGASLIALSAQTGAGMEALMPAILEAYGHWTARLKTADLNEWLRLAVERNPPPAVAGRRMKPKYVVQTKSRPPTFVLFASRADQITDSWRRYLVNSMRQSFDLPGAPIRITVRSGSNPYASSGTKGHGRSRRKLSAGHKSR